MSQLEINAPNRWRLETPGHAGWSRTARPDDPNKYFIVSADCHANEPSNLWAERIDAKYRDRLPRVTTDANGVKWRVSEGHRPDRLRTWSGKTDRRSTGRTGCAWTRWRARTGSVSRRAPIHGTGSAITSATGSTPR